MKKILLGHLNSNGDCLFATVVARQIKEIDFPGCHLTWAVNSYCRQSVLLNPYVDDIWEVQTAKTLTTEEEWTAFAAEAEKRRENGEFDAIFYTQIIKGNWMNYDGGIRSSIYNNYPKKIEVPHTPIIRLSESEVENVRQFALTHQLDQYEQVILVECGPASFDSALNFQSACELVKEFISENENIAFILSSNKQFDSELPQIIDGSRLTFRENAELSKYCNLLIGCGSGISWLSTTDWAKKLNMILVINQNNYVNPSMIHDHSYLNLPVTHIIEISSNQESLEKVKSCLRRVLKNDFAGAREIFNETIKNNNYTYLQQQLELSAVNYKFGEFFSCLNKSLRRNGVKLLFNRHFRAILWRLYKIFINKSLKTMRLRKTTSIQQFK